jgi:SAM-dependent methyltransferase
MYVSFEEWSYGRHSVEEREQTGVPSCYTAPDSIDAWRHRRMLDTLLPLLQAYPGASWLTLGDGNYASEAHYLLQHGADATASSITDATLGSAHERGYIRKYRAENAEALSVPSASFDFVMCKESYHHFPRPPLAFYEMWRAARRALVLIEPIDGPRRTLEWFKYAVKKFLRGDATDQFENSGNFIFRVSVREVEKMATALNAPFIAVRRYNDCYYAKAARDRRGAPTVGNLITNLLLLVQDVLCALRLLNHGLATVIVLKDEIDAPLRERLENAGFSILRLPENPYVNVVNQRS